MIQKIREFFLGKEETQKPIEVNPDLVNYKPAREVIEAIRSKIDFDVESLEFDNDDISNYTLSALSKEAKQKILDIIHEDLRNNAEINERNYEKFKGQVGDTKLPDELFETKEQDEEK